MTDERCINCEYAYKTSIVILCGAVHLTRVTVLEECPKEKKNESESK